MRSEGGLLLALILAVRALSLSTADGLSLLGLRRAPMSSTRLTRASWLAILWIRLAMILGDGASHGAMIRGAAVGLVPAQLLVGLHSLSVVVRVPLAAGRLVESRLVTVMVPPPSTS